MSPSNRIMRGKQRGKKKGGAKVAVTEGVDNPKGQPPTVKPALSIEDPWRQLRSPLGGKLSPAEEWKRLKNSGNQGRVLTLPGNVALTLFQSSSSDELASNLRLAAQDSTTGGGANVIPSQPGIAAKAEEDGMENAEGTAEDENRRAVEKLIVTWDEEVPPTRLPGLSEAAHQILTNGLTSLNLSGCHLIDDDVGNIALSWTPWLREINLARNKLTKAPALSGLGKLQALDLSNNNIADLGPEGNFPAELGPTLRHLDLSFNSLTSLMAVRTVQAIETETDGRDQAGEDTLCALQLLQSLLHLNVAHNKLDNIGLSISAVTRGRFPQLISLDFRGNPIPPIHRASEITRFTKGLPTLSTLDGEAVVRTGMTLSSKQPIFELLSTAEQEGRREESCSCVEGNPCLVAYNCRDWANRFAVAAAAAASSK